MDVGSRMPVGSTAPGRPDVVTLRFLHTNDMHGAISPLKDSVILGHPSELGGAAYLATIANRVRSQDPERTMLLDAGDSVHGKAATDLSEGLAMADVMNAVGYDAATIGNHDFQWGVPGMEKRLGRERFPTVIANVFHEDGTPFENSQPYIQRDMGGVQVGVLGMLTTETAAEQRADKLEGARFMDEGAVLSTYLPEMAAKGVEVPVILTHQGLDEDIDQARCLALDGTRGVLFIGGHSHDRTPEAIEVQGNWVVQAGSNAKEVGLLEVDFDRDSKQIVNVRHSLIPLDPEAIPADPAVAEIVQRYEKKARKKLGNVFTIVSKPLTRCNSQDSLLGNIVTDAMRKAVKADVAFMNSDGLRKDLPSGFVTVGHLYEVFPFPGQLMKGKMRGNQLLEALEHSLSFRQTDPEVQSSFLQVSGLKFEYDASRPVGERLLNVEVEGRPIDRRQWYTVAVEDFLASGKNGYTSFVHGRRFHQMGATVSETVQNYLSSNRRTLLDAPIPPRIVDRTPL